MHKRIVWALGSVLAGAGLSLAQEPAPKMAPATGEVVVADGSARDPALCPCPSDAPGAAVWVHGEYLVWWLRDAPLRAPIATTVSGQAAVPFAPENAGALGADGTRVLSPNDLGAGSYSGLRVGAGLWLAGERSVGAEAVAFLLPARSAAFGAAATLANGPALLVPFVNAAASPPAESALPLGGQGQA
ncbi:MAG TPA: BBP7 family outer membrane beta-barrel protein, partial [Gemmataceae bacterium]|nr:BBP7 family outer membrane beta-barrel protein [Gemmataceae bacterium]